MNDLIYNQTRIPKEKWRYGLRSSAATGCGWIATYNALRLLGYDTDVEKLITSYERMLPLIHGNAGTTLFAPAIKFRKWGFPVDVVLDRERFDEAAQAADVCILFYHWREDLKFGAHFVALRHGEQGFTGYNTFRNSIGPDPYGPSLREFIRRQKFFGTVLIAIRDKR